jgi:formylglycine-generating enzyme required for sulfatase activity
VDCQLDVSGCGPPPGMVEVPGGMFEMGSTAGDVHEMPIRQVQVDAFWMDETEVTVDAYSACVDDGACTEPNADSGNCNWMVAGREDHPVNCVGWYDAEDYCGWAEGGTKRLPTEAEWEKAARGTDAREYPWGDSPAPSCTHVVMSGGGSYGCGMDSTWAVGSKPLGDSPYGAHDMAGNVYEWVADWWADSYDAAETDNPTGPVMGSYRVLRGGFWAFSTGDYFRAAHRASSGPSHGAGDAHGFRCARTPPAAP